MYRLKNHLLVANLFVGLMLMASLASARGTLPPVGTSTAGSTPASTLGVPPATVDLPYSGSVATAGAAFFVRNTGTGVAINGRGTSKRGITGISDTGPEGVYGQSGGLNAAGVHGFANNGTGAAGVYGRSNQGIGVGGRSVTGHGVTGYSAGAGAGVLGESAQFNAVRGIAHNSNHGSIVGIHVGGGFGVFGLSTTPGLNGKTGPGVVGDSIDWIGTYGESDKYDGVQGFSRASAHAGVAGHNNAGGYGVFGHTNAGTGIRGGTDGGGGNSHGVYGVAFGVNGNGVTGDANNGSSSYAIWGRSTNGWAGVFSGKVAVYGALTKPAGSFKIDHPVDPENKYLYHSFVESPDMLNIYNGNITTDSRGAATVALPAYFQALNRDFRYQLTVMGQFAQAIVAQEIKGNRFVIKTDKPNVKVSWQVTGIRQDAYANAHRIPVEEVKPTGERGKYLYPRELGKPESVGVNYEREQALNAQTRQTRPPVSGLAAPQPVK